MCQGHEWVDLDGHCKFQLFWFCESFRWIGHVYKSQYGIPSKEAGCIQKFFLEAVMLCHYIFENPLAAQMMAMAGL